MESDPGFKKEQDIDRSLVDKESDGGLFNSEIEEENQKALHEYILHRFKELVMESDREFKKERLDRSLADKESHGGFESKIEKEEDIHLRLNESAMELSNPEFKKEREDRIARLSELAMESYRFSFLANKESYGGFKPKTVEANPDEEDRTWHSRILERIESNGGFKNREIEENADESDSSDSSEDVEATLRIEEEVDPIEELEEIVMKFQEFIDYTFPSLKDEEKLKLEWQDKFEFLEKIRHMLLTSSRRMDTVIEELEHMKKDENGEEEEAEDSFSSAGKAQIPEILIELININAFLLERSFHHGIAFLFNNNFTEKELSSGEDEFNQSRETLGMILFRIRELKNDKKIEDCKEDDELKMEESEKFQGSAFVASQLPNGFER